LDFALPAFALAFARARAAFRRDALLPDFRYEPLPFFFTAGREVDTGADVPDGAGCEPGGRDAG
jgi:hypothetical protein